MCASGRTNSCQDTCGHIEKSNRKGEGQRAEYNLTGRFPEKIGSSGICGNGGRYERDLTFHRYNAGQVGNPKLVLLFDCPESIAEKRFLTRKLPGRETDDIQTFRKRYHEFRRLNPGIVASYEKKGILLKVRQSSQNGLVF